MYTGIYFLLKIYWNAYLLVIKVIKWRMKREMFFLLIFYICIYRDCFICFQAIQTLQYLYILFSVMCRLSLTILYIFPFSKNTGFKNNLDFSFAYMILCMIIDKKKGK